MTNGFSLTLMLTLKLKTRDITAVVSAISIYISGPRNYHIFMPLYGKSIVGSLELLWRVEEEKERIKQEIILAGDPLKEAVKLLMTIKGVTPLTALAFLADVGDKDLVERR